MSSPQWTQDEAIAFECAQEVITDLIAINMAEIYQEEAKPNPDAERLAALRIEVAALWKDRDSISVKDQDKIARACTEYGEKVRAYRAAQQTKSAA